MAFKGHNAEVRKAACMSWIQAWGVVVGKLLLKSRTWERLQLLVRESVCSIPIDQGVVILVISTASSASSLTNKRFHINGGFQFLKTSRTSLFGLQVTDVQFSPDGYILASAAADGQVKLWDLRAGKPMHTFQVSTVALMSRVTRWPLFDLSAAA